MSYLTPKEQAVQKLIAYAKELGFSKAEPIYWNGDGDSKIELFEDWDCVYEVPQQVWLGISLRDSLFTATPGNIDGDPGIEIVADTKDECQERIYKHYDNIEKAMEKLQKEIAGPDVETPKGETDG